MALDLSDTLVVGISATALFDLSEADEMFKKNLKDDKDIAIRAYREFMLQREEEYLEDGTGMPLVKALLKLNRYQDKESNAPLVEVVVMSRNSPESGVRVLNNIRDRNLPIIRHAFTGGESVTDYLDAFDVDLFLRTHAHDAQIVIDANICAVALVKEPPKDIEKIPKGQVRIAFDGDAVIFDEASEIVFKTKGKEQFYQDEDSKKEIPMKKGPYANLLEKLSRLQEKLPFSVEFSPIKIAIVTARSAPAEMRVIKTLRKWGIYVDEIFFLGGLDKSRVLRAFKPHIFFDDQDVHLDKTSLYIPSGKVPYSSDSPLSQKKTN